MAHQVEPELVIARLSNIVGQLHTELAMRDVALEALQKENDSLRQPANKPAEPERTAP